MSRPVDTAAMLQDLSQAFPFLWKRPLKEWGENWKNAEGVWTGIDTGHVMPDGQPIFGDFSEEAGTGYDLGIHEGFASWLHARGWYAEWWDAETVLLVPDGETA